MIGAGIRRLLSVRGWPALLLLLLLAGPAHAQLPPDARWRILDTPHFRVNFMAGLDSLARRTAARAEWAYELLSRELADPPAGKIDIILADNVDFANGSATPLPTNRIILYAHPPADVAELSFTTDWLELLVLHELVHIFHLDDAGGVWEVLRAALGRNALLFPHAYAPPWLVEGLATHYESKFTPAGRVRGSLFEMMLRTAVLEDAFFTIDRASGTPRSWPAGATRYVYGALFLDHLERRQGLAGFQDFVETYGSQTIPYRLDRAARRSVGESFSDAWEEWRDSLRMRYRATADSLRATGLTEPEILTTAGRAAHHPRYAPDGRRIAYSAATGHDEPGIRIVRADGSERELAPRAVLGPITWTADGAGILYGDLQFRGPHRIFSDLWRAETGGGERRLTRSARVAQPDLHPDGRTVVAVQDAGGTNVLVVGDVDGGGFRPLTESSLDIHWAEPRWSPSGDEIAAVRWSAGGLHDIVVLDRSGGLIREITRDRAVDGSPAWSPEGRHLLFWSDRSGIPNLYAFDLREERLHQVSNVLTGAVQPDVSPDGRWIVFSFYRSDGYHIARLPFDPSRWRPAAPPRKGALPLDSARVHLPAGGEVRPYSPWPTVAPAAWTLLTSAGTDLGPGAGVAMGGFDVVQRHLWTGAALWHLEGGRFDGGGVYRYQGWGNPAVELSAAQAWTVACSAGSITCGSEEPLSSALLRREREASASLLWVRQRVRSTAWLRPAAIVSTRELRWKETGAGAGLTLRETPADLGLRVEAGRSSVRSFPLSVGPQAGYSLVGSAEGHRYTAPLEGAQDAAGYLRTVGRGRGYRSLVLGGSTQVLAFRADAGFEFGSRSPGFDVGGASGGALPVALELDLFGGGLAFPIRGYPEGVQFGSRAVSASAEYRFPLLRVERGVGLLPLYLDRFTGNLFADAGTAWCPGECPIRLSAAPDQPRPLSSVGAEVLTELRFGFHTVLPLRIGVALPLQGEGRARFHLRVGRAF